jgi:hypothetical protein
MSDRPIYLHVPPGGPLPDVAHLSPFRAVVVVDALVTSEWQAKVSDWLVQSGCLYMLAWGRECSSWDDSVDIAKLEHFDYKDIPEDRAVMTTWHADEPLTEAFAFCKQHASHPVVAIQNTMLLHIAEHSDESQVLAAYAEA